MKDERLSNCCSKKVFGEYDNPLGEPPTGICRGCKDHASFYTEEEFEKINCLLNGGPYGEKMCSRCGKNPAQEDHVCPYAEEGESVGDDETLCDCCPECEQQCMWDI